LPSQRLRGSCLPPARPKAARAPWIIRVRK
jgi:hypothetical protein